MLFVLAILYAVHITIEAAPSGAVNLTNVPTSALEAVQSTSEAIQSICPNHQRSIWDITRSCLVTIFACSWVSIHPNIPPPGKKWWKICWRRVQLMFWALVCPELMMFWAMRQWSGARQLAHQYREQGWTKTHGYFIQMGGFTLYQGKESKGILSPEKMQILLLKGMIEFPTISEEDIQDRSKSDGISKALAILQTTWFISQCIGRRVQGLEITQLELVTVALALLNGMIYYFWWNKPFDVRCSVPIYLLDEPLKERCKVVYYLSENTGVFTTLKQAPSLFYQKTFSAATLSRERFFACWRFVTDKEHIKKLGKAIIISPVWLIMVLFATMNRMAGEAEIIVGDGESSVPMFYAVDISKRDDLILAFLTVGVIFGGVHCVGWTFDFPSRNEMILWRLSSIIITVTPLLMLIGIKGQILSKRLRLGTAYDTAATIVGIVAFTFFLSMLLPGSFFWWTGWQLYEIYPPVHLTFWSGQILSHTFDGDACREIIASSRVVSRCCLCFASFSVYSLFSIHRLF